MKKYRTKRWPFLICLFSGLACSISIPQLKTNGDQVCHAEKRALYPKVNEVEYRGVKKETKQIRHYNEAYPVGPQLLLVLQ